VKPLAIKIVIIDKLGEKISIEERPCPRCKYPSALAMVEPSNTHHFVAWCPCSTVFELNDDGIKILAQRPPEFEPEPEWWLKHKK